MAGGYDQAKYRGEKGVYTHAGAFQACGKISLDLVFDSDFRKATAFAKRWHTTAAESMERIVKSYHDIVSVCTPDQTHYAIVKALLLNKSCKTLCVEKPAAETSQQHLDLMRLARKSRIHVVTNFQRHFDKTHMNLAEYLKRMPANILAVRGLYIKGLNHNGVTMVDTLRLLLGNPRSLLATRRVLNRQVSDYSYDFVLFYPHFVATVCTTDSNRWLYNYHVFDIDILLKDRRISIVDNSRAKRESRLGRLGYSGVKGLNDLKPVVTRTQYLVSMKYFADYLFRISTQQQVPTQNTLESSYVNMLILEAVQKSYQQGLRKIHLPEFLWKK